MAPVLPSATSATRPRVTWRDSPAATACRSSRRDRAGRSRLHEMEAVVSVDDGGDLVVRRDLEKVGLELLAFGDVDWVSSIGQLDLFEHDRHLLPVGVVHV